MGKVDAPPPPGHERSKPVKCPSIGYFKTADRGRGSAWSDWFVAGGGERNMNLKRRLSSLSRPKKPIMVGEKEGTLPQYHHHQQGSSISDPSVVSDEEPRNITRRVRATNSPLYSTERLNAKQGRTSSTPASDPNAPVLYGTQDNRAATYGGDIHHPASSDRSNWPSTSPQPITPSDKQGGIPRPGGGRRHSQHSSGDSRVMPNGFQRTPAGVHQQRLGNRESGGLLRLNGSQGWTAPRWQEGGDRPETGKLEGCKAENGRSEVVLPGWAEQPLWGSASDQLLFGSTLSLIGEEEGLSARCNDLLGDCCKFKTLYA